MDLPMAGQQPAQQPGPQQQQPAEQAGGDKKGPFPANRAEAKAFANDLLEIIYADGTHDNLVGQLDNVGENGVPVGQGLGVISAQLVGNRIQDVRRQTGRPIEMGLVANALKAVITEFSELGEDHQFFRATPEDKKQALQVAVQGLDSMASGGGQQ